MVRGLLIVAAMFGALPALADTVVPVRNIRANTVLSATDLAVLQDNRPSALSRIEDVVGLEAKVVLYQGRPIGIADIGPAAVVDRNEIVVLIFRRGGLAITTDGRSLGRAGPGETVRVMNLASRTTVSGTVAPDGSVIVGSIQDLK